MSKDLSMAEVVQLTAHDQGYVVIPPKSGHVFPDGKMVTNHSSNPMYYKHGEVMSDFDDKFDESMPPDSLEAHGGLTKEAWEAHQAAVAAGKYEFTPEEVELASKDPQAFFTKYPVMLLKLSLDDLKQLSKEHEFDFIKLAAKAGHPDAPLTGMTPIKSTTPAEMLKKITDKLNVPENLHPSILHKLSKAHQATAEEDAKAVSQLPVLCWYDSETHSKRRYYAGAKGKGGGATFTYDKKEAVVLTNADHAFLARLVCRMTGYKKVNLSKPEDC